MINILFSGNEKVFDGMLTCMLSIFKRTQTTEPFHFYILTMDVSHIKPEYTAVAPRQALYLEQVAKEYHPDNCVTRCDVSSLYEEEFANCPNEQCYCSPYTLLRLFADKMPRIAAVSGCRYSVQP